MSFDIPKECAADPYALAMLGGVQIFRIKARGKDLFDGKLGAHNRRDKVPLYAKKRPGRERAVELWQDRERALRILELSEAQPKRRGKPPAPGVEIFIGGPSPYDSPEEWTDEQVMAYGRDAVQWVRDRLGGDPATAAGVLVEAHAHQDEASPHSIFRSSLRRKPGRGRRRARSRWLWRARPRTVRGRGRDGRTSSRREASAGVLRRRRRPAALSDFRRRRGRRADGREGERPMADERADYVFLLDGWESAAAKQKWICAGCGQTVAPGVEAGVRAVPAGGGRYEPVLVHAHCRDSMLQAGNWAAWEDRIQHDDELYDVDAAHEALLAAVPLPAPKPAPAAVPAAKPAPSPAG